MKEWLKRLRERRIEKKRERIREEFSGLREDIFVMHEQLITQEIQRLLLEILPQIKVLSDQATKSEGEIVEHLLETRERIEKVLQAKTNSINYRLNDTKTLLKTFLVNQLLNEMDIESIERERKSS